MMAIINLDALNNSDVLALRTMRLLRLTSFLRCFEAFKSLGKRGGPLLVAKRMLYLVCFLVSMALISTSFFWEEFDPYFGCFSRSLYTMFLVGMKGDTSLTWEASLDVETGLLHPVFSSFFALHIVCCYGLIIYAITGFARKTTTESHDWSELDVATVKYLQPSPIDPLLSEMRKYIKEDELHAMIDDLFRLFAAPTETKTGPANEISFEDMKQGLRNFDPPIYFNRDNWDDLVLGFLSPGKETLDSAAFSSVMQTQLERFILKGLMTNVAAEEQDNHSSFMTTKFAVKMMMLEKSQRPGAATDSSNNRQIASILNTKLETLQNNLEHALGQHRDNRQHQLEESMLCIEREQQALFSKVENVCNGIQEQREEISGLRDDLQQRDNTLKRREEAILNQLERMESKIASLSVLVFCFRRPPTLSARCLTLCFRAGGHVYVGGPLAGLLENFSRALEEHCAR